MLLNFTNHPFETWDSIQKDAAIQEFDAVVDFQFPEINPELDEMELEKLVRKYLEEILVYKPSAVHIMGEMNFTFQMIYFLMQNKIPCYASTSERNMEKKGDQITNTFVFKRFRKYRFLDFLFKDDVTTIDGFELSKDQSEAFDTFKNFLSKENNDRVFILKGYAGTGKTTLLKFFYNYAMENDLKPIVATPTNKAKNIVKGKLGDSANVLTVHSLLYTFEDIKETKEDAWTGGDGQIYQNFVPKNAARSIKYIFNLDPFEDLPKEFANNIVFIFDEASMLSTLADEKIYVTKFGSGSLIGDFFKVYGTRLKYVFVGDTCQLPPPNEETISHALTKEYFENEFELPTIEKELTKVKRQGNDSGILDIATELRKKMVSKKLGNWPKFDYKLNYSDVALVQSADEIVKEYIQHIEKYGLENCSIICYTNEQAKNINLKIKQLLHSDSNLKVGDILVNNQKNQLFNIDNSERLLVLEIYDYRKRNSNFSFLKLKVKVLTTGEIIECYILEDFLFNNNPQLTPEEAKFMMIDFDKRMRENNIKRKTGQYNIAFQNDIYLNALKCKFGHAITIHKSQGSEWDYVFIPLTSKDFALKERSPELVLNIAKLMYTAITRARTKVFLTDGFWIKGYNIRYPKNL
jgi:hypothetical protein